MICALHTVGIIVVELVVIVWADSIMQQRQSTAITSVERAESESKENIDDASERRGGQCWKEEKKTSTPMRITIAK